MSTRMGAKNWCFTTNNYSAQLDLPRIPGLLRAVYQEEIGEEGTPHLQGYVSFTGRVTLAKLKDLPCFEDGTHFEVAKGSPAQNYEYCTKEECRLGGPYEYGTFPNKHGSAGARTDVIALREAVRAKRTFQEIMEDDATILPLAKYSKFYEKATSVYNKPLPRPDMRVILCYGPPGTGKSHCTGMEDATRTDIFAFDGGRFWNGYCGQTTVVLDEFKGHVMTPDFFNRLCDKYPLTVETKGSSEPMLATTVRITSNHLPSSWWKEGTHYNPLSVSRRIHEVHHHTAIKQYTRFVSDDPTDPSGKSAMDKLVDSMK